MREKSRLSLSVVSKISSDPFFCLLTTSFKTFSALCSCLNKVFRDICALPKVCVQVEASKDDIKIYLNINISLKKYKIIETRYLFFFNFHF